jgi:HlyD family secretion protein
MKRWIIALVLVLALTGGGLWYWKYHTVQKTTRYFTADLKRGELVLFVRASGLIKPIQLVDVGTQVNGRINKLYVDYNSLVKAGDLVAQIDPITYEARFAQDQANLMSARANVEQTTAKLVQADKELTRTKTLAGQNMLSETDLDAAIAVRDALAAQLKVSKATVEQTEASLRLSQANLSYTTIRSPVDGVVITRNVSEGQTVVSSMNAMTLFKIATDLRTIQVEASIPEADIGRIREGQNVTFTVDAFDTVFTGKVEQVRMSASTMQNVVTYPVIVNAENQENRLFPGMTAIIICEVAQRTNVLKVANAALRFKPAEKKSAEAEPKRKRLGPRVEQRPKVWIRDSPDSEPTPVAVKLGISDGIYTEILEPCPLTEGQELITGIDVSNEDKKTINPFAPKMPGSTPRARR